MLIVVKPMDEEMEKTLIEMGGVKCPDGYIVDISDDQLNSIRKIFSINQSNSYHCDMEHKFEYYYDYDSDTFVKKEVI